MSGLLATASEKGVTSPLRVLVADDNPIDAELAVAELKRAAIAIDHRIVATKSDFRTILVDFTPDVILCDFAFPDFDGLEALKIARQICPQTPFIFVTGTLSEEKAVVAVQNGAVDYVLKSSLIRLAGSVLRAIEEASEKKQRQALEARLDQAREQLANISSSIDEVLASYSIDERRFLYVSPAAERLYGHGLDAFFAWPSTWKDAIVPEDRPVADAAKQRLFERGSYDIDYRIVRGDGRRRWVNHRARLAYDEHGKPIRVDSVVLDITERMQQQARLRRLLRIRDLLSAVNAAIVRIHDRGDLFRDACRIAYEAGGFVRVDILSFDANRAGVHVEATAGKTDPPDCDALGAALMTVKRLEHVVGPALAASGPGILNDLSAVAPDRFEGLGGPGILALGVFPLIVKGEAVGAMSFATSEAGFFDAEEVELLASLCGNLSFALNHLAEQHRVARLTRIRDILSAVNAAIVRTVNREELFHETCRIAFEGGHFDNVFVFTVSPDKRRAQLQALQGGFDREGLAERLQSYVETFERAGNTIQRALAMQAPAFVNDIEAAAQAVNAKVLAPKGIRSVACFPIVVGGRVVGGLALNTFESGYFDDEEVALITSLTSNLALALDRLDTQERVMRLSRIRDILSSVNQAIVRIQDRDELLREACRIAFQAGGYVNAFAFLLTKSGPELRAVKGSWESHPADLAGSLGKAVEKPDSGTVIASALRTAKPAMINDIRERADVPAYRPLIKDGVIAAGAFPLLVGGQVVGAFVFDTTEAGYFDDEETELLTALAANLSFALEHIERQSRVERLSRIRDVLSAVNVAIVRIQEKVELCEEVCRIAVEAGGYRNVYIVELDIVKRTFAIPAFLGASSRDSVERGVGARVTGGRDRPGIVEEAIRSTRPVTRNDLRRDGRRGSQGIRAVSSLPLTIDGAAFGAMVFETAEVDYFDEEEVQLLTSLANNLSFALDLLEKRRRVDYLSYYDALTRLPNRTLFFDRLAQELATTKRAGKSLAMVLLDLPRFSILNNTLGEHVGDEVLRQVAQRLNDAFGERVVARVAGDRFALSFPMLDDLRSVTELLTEDGIRLFEAPIVVEDRELHVMPRAGCAVFPGDGEDAETLFQNVEAALMSAKSTGTHYRFYAPDLNARFEKQLDLEARLQTALEEHQFVLFYQPKVDVATRKIIGFEALVRWRDPERGLVSPGDFIPVLEQTGFIVPLGRWALVEAARQYEAWREAGLRPPRIAVNLSTVQLRSDRIVDDVKHAVETFTADCGLDVEVTESMLMENFDTAIAKLSAIRDVGVNLSLDDFGTGYSSLAYIHRLPLNALKIDRSFIVGMTDDPNKTSIVTTIISLGNALRLKVIAEGVEHEEEARLLQLLRCDQIQGYLFGKPLPPEEAVQFLKS